MRTTVEIDEKLLATAERMSGEKSPSKIVNKALEEYIRKWRAERLIASLGTRDLDLDDWYEFRHQERT
jgi:Arc/MetJ family transcription regulator